MGTAAADLAAAAAVAAVAAAFPFVGRGTAVKALIDKEATAAIERVLGGLHGLGALAVRGSEGPRDGSPALDLPDAGPADLDVYCDPIDGTLCAARGGPRAHSVVALAPSVTERREFPDEQSIFALGGDPDVATALDAPGRWTQLIEACFAAPGRTAATLNRDDNFGLLRLLGGFAASDFATGSAAGYRPTVSGRGCLAVGDATVTLPFECDLEFGRIGYTEAQIQSALYRGWVGIPVSRDRIRAHPHGLRAYLDDLLAARAWGDERAIACLFTEQESAYLRACGGGLADATAPLTVDEFGPGGAAVVAIAALNSTRDPALPGSIEVLPDPRWSSRDGCLEVHVLTAAGGTVSRRLHRVAVAEHPALSPRIRALYQDLDPRQSTP